jgi:hypothetical protein
LLPEELLREPGEASANIMCSCVRPFRYPPQAATPTAACLGLAFPQSDDPVRAVLGIPIARTIVSSAYTKPSIACTGNRVPPKRRSANALTCAAEADTNSPLTLDFARRNRSEPSQSLTRTHVRLRHGRCTGAPRWAWHRGIGAARTSPKARHQPVPHGDVQSPTSVRRGLLRPADAITRVNALGLALIALSARSGDPVPDETENDEQAQLRCKRLQRILHQSKEYFST